MPGCLVTSGARERSVLFVDNTSTFGGAINSLGELIDAFPATGYEPIVATAQSEDILAERLPGVRTIAIPPMSWSKGARGGRLRRRLHTIRKVLGTTFPEAVRIARMARREDVDLVHLNNNMESQEAVVLGARLAGIPCVAHARSFQRPARSLRWVARLVDGHIAISHAVARNLVELGAPDDRVYLVHDGIDPDRFGDVPSQAECRQVLGIPEGVPAFGIFGRIIPWKGIDEFVRASIQVIREKPDAIAFVVGDVSDGDESYHQGVRKLIDDAGLKDRILLPGYQADIRPLMAGLDLVVHASTTPEPFGMVVIEAMAVRRPVVATRGGGPDDIVIPGETGILVDRGSVPQMRDAILRILNSPDRGRAMGEEGRRRMESHFTSQLYAEKTIRIYDELLNNSGASRHQKVGRIA
jgi:predicted outer membrane repeat protein